jgi:hypothetical protein
VSSHFFRRHGFPPTHTRLEKNRCLSVLPYNSCNLKHTVEAFNFLAFFFIFANVMIETFYFGWNLRSQATTTLNELCISTGG